jgi:PAS domain S-box-containing protein
LTVPDGTILSANPAAQHMFGMTEEEIRKAGREGLVVNDQRLKFALKRRAETGSFHTELTYRRKDGSTFEGEVTSNIFRDADGSVKTSMIVRDITERKNAEEALRRSEERFSKAFNVNPAAISISRINDGLLVNVNETYLSLSGFSREEVIGRTSTKLGFFTDSSSRKQLLELLQARGTVRNYEMAFLTKNRKLINATVSLDKITIDNEDYMISTVTDITERKRMELSLQEYTKNLEALVEQRTKELKEKERLAAIGQTAGMVGHDIRNPLQAMLSDVYLLKCELESMNQCRTKESVTESLDSLESNIAYVNKIVSDLQDYTKALKPSIEEVNIKEIIWSTLSTNIQTNIETEVIVEDSLCVKADRTYLKRVMSNLVINAVQAMPNGGKLTVRSKRQQDELVISVEDTGLGIPDDIKPNLFTPLFTTKSKGQGLGLAVVRRLVVEGLGGKISFVTDIGKGTKFVVSLPTKQ